MPVTGEPLDVRVAERLTVPTLVPVAEETVRVVAATVGVGVGWTT